MGSSATRPFRTLQKASDAAEPGDTILIGDGVYPDGGDTKFNDSSIVRLAKVGRTDAWITFRAAPGARPVLRPKGWGGVTGAHRPVGSGPDLGAYEQE